MLINLPNKSDVVWDSVWSVAAHKDIEEIIPADS